MIFRLIGLLVLIAMAIAPVENLRILMRPEIQLVVATIIAAVVVIYDPWGGLLLGAGLIVAYYRLSNKDIHYIDSSNLRNKGPMVDLIQQFITPQNLKDAQSNVVNDREYDSDVVGIDGMYGHPVYGAQGLDDKMPGWEKSRSLTGQAIV
jgi:hypothetical protein